MIVFDLRCGSGAHVFEAWFASSDSFTDQQARGLLCCPVCGDTDVGKAVTAARLAAKANRSVSPVPAEPSPGHAPSPEVVQAVMAHIASKQAEALPSSTWVGTNFAVQARAMHSGESEAAMIHGQATREEAEALHDDGIAVMPLLVPVVPPELQN